MEGWRGAGGCKASRAQGWGASVRGERTRPKATTMQNALPVALSAQVSLQTRLDTLADNVANAATPGFLATKVRFEAAVERHGGPSVAFARVGDAHLAHARGGITRTGAPLDFAVRGEAWMAVATDQGTALTRDGRFHMLPGGELVSREGHAVLGPGEAPVLLDPAGGEPIAGADGSISQDGRIVASIGLFETDRPPRVRVGDTAVLPDGAPVPVIGRSDVGLVQGHVEGSNVNAVEEMVRLIEVTRGFEGVSGLVRRTDGTLGEALRTLAGR